MGGRCGGGAPSQAREGGAPKEQARVLVNVIIKYSPGGSPNSGKVLSKRPRPQNHGGRGGGQQRKGRKSEDRDPEKESRNRGRKKIDEGGKNMKQEEEEVP